MTLLSTGTDYEQLAATFRPIFARIAQGAAAREQNRILPDEQIRWLKEAGFGTVRIPREKGGWGASLPQLIALLIELVRPTPTCRRRCGRISPSLKTASINLTRRRAIAGSVASSTASWWAAAGPKSARSGWGRFSPA